MRLPKNNYDFDGHIKKIESIQDKLRWGIMFPENVRNILDKFRASGRIKPIYYMGNKPGIVLQQSEFSDWFKEEPWMPR